VLEPRGDRKGGPTPRENLDAPVARLPSIDAGADLPNEAVQGRYVRPTDREDRTAF
jgi:hypothetical protein